MYGLRASHPQSRRYYGSLFELYAEWGVDFVKIDDICNTNIYPHDPYSAKREIEMLREAADHCGRPMILSLSPGPAPLEAAGHLRENANMWRVTDDFWDDWGLLLDMFSRCEAWMSHVGPGGWPDCDMLPLGWIGERFGEPRKTRFTKDEQVAMMTLWSVFRSPMMLGCDLTKLEDDDWTLGLITNDEVLDVGRNGFNPTLARRNAGEAVWESAEGRFLALFNLSDEARAISLGDGKRYRDLWKRAETTENEAVAAPHGARLFRRLDI
jgi:hypothetical protein